MRAKIIVLLALGYTPKQVSEELLVPLSVVHSTRRATDGRIEKILNQPRKRGYRRNKRK